MATVDWVYPVTSTISGTTLINDTDDKLQAAMDDLTLWINSGTGYLTTGLSQSMVDVTTAQTIAGIKTFSDIPVFSTGLTTTGLTTTGITLGSTAITATGDELNMLDGVTAIDSDTYTPTLTDSSNVASSDLGGASYIRIGDIVYVSGRVGIDVTATATTTVLYISLPITITSNFTDGSEGYGVIASATASGEIFSTSGSKTMTVIFTSATASNDIFSFNFSYEIN